MSDGERSDLDPFQNDDDEYFDLEPFAGPDIPVDLIGTDAMHSDRDSQPQMTQPETVAFAHGPTARRAVPSASPRRAYGQGIDAQRTAIFRHSQMRNTILLEYLRRLFPVITFQVLNDLIVGALANCSEGTGPKRPTRTQRRVKGGLLAWMDYNSAFMYWYLRRRYGL
jgi:hypothetical protein